MALSLSRNAKFVVDDGISQQEIGILDGFSFSQATGTQNVTKNESGDSPDRSQSVFNTSLEPVEWSFTSYIRPSLDSTGAAAKHGMAEAILWNALVSDTLDTGSNAAASGINSTITGLTVSFGASNKNQLLTLTGYFKFDDKSFKLTDMCVNSASVDFDIDGIAQISWSGYASTVTSTNVTVPAFDANPKDADFILNKLSTCTLKADGSMGDEDVRTLALTGGNITIDNGISYVTPEELGVINKPFKHQTGTRAISGSINAYLDSVSSNNSNGVYDLILEDANGVTPEVTNSFALLINIGASSLGTDNADNKPGVLFTIPKAHLELPSIDTADVMGVTINFTALEGTGQDELSLKYIGKTPV